LKITTQDIDSLSQGITKDNFSTIQSLFVIPSIINFEYAKKAFTVTATPSHRLNNVLTLSANPGFIFNASGTTILPSKSFTVYEVLPEISKNATADIKINVDKMVSFEDGKVATITSNNFLEVIQKVFDIKGMILVSFNEGLEVRAIVVNHETNT
jgi:hypothetical protein